MVAFMVELFWKQLFSEGKLYLSTSLISTIALHIEMLSSVDGMLELIQEPDGVYLKPKQHYGINWRPEPRFGRIKIYWLYSRNKRQAPVHNPIILCNLLLFGCAFKLLELIENLRCIILGSYCLNTTNRVRIVAMLIGPVKVEWLPVTRKLYRS